MYFKECAMYKEGMEELIRTIIRYIGDDPEREGLKDTPARVVRMWQEIFNGYKKSPSEYAKTFGMEKYDEMIVLRNIEVYSMCENHMLPFYGVAHVAYVPAEENNQVVEVIGVSKIARIVDTFSRRLQIQERLTDQITSFLMRELKPQGVGCIIKARHLCMMMRGVQKQHSEMITSSMIGLFRDDNKAREEFINLCR